MIIAVTYENEQVFGHFGRTKQFKLYTVLKGEVVSSEVVDTNGSGHGALAEFLSNLEVGLLICGGIGGGAQMALAQVGISIIGGITGNADEAVAAFLNGTLEDDPENAVAATMTVKNTTAVRITAASMAVAADAADIAMNKNKKL